MSRLLNCDVLIVNIGRINFLKTGGAIGKTIFYIGQSCRFQLNIVELEVNIARESEVREVKVEAAQSKSCNSKLLI